MATCRYRRSAVPEVSPWLAHPARDDGDTPLPPKRGSRSQPVVGHPPETMATCRYRRSAVPEVSPWLAQPTRDDGDMPLPPKRGSRSQPVVGPAHPRRRRHAATAEARFRKSARGWPIPPETTATRRYRRSAVPEVSTGLACLPRDNGDMRRYRRRAVVEGACRQVTCCNPKFP